MKDKIDTIAKIDGRYPAPAIRFVYEGLGYASRHIKIEPAHVSGQALCSAIKDLAIERWGRLAGLVLNNWNIRTTRDFGEIVYTMIKHKWMSAQPHDNIEDFDNVYDFQTVFKDQFSF